MRPPETRDDVVENIQAWHDAINNLGRYRPDVRRTLLQTVSRTQAWIVIYRDGRWLAAPMKFVGCGVKMTPELYERKRFTMNPNVASDRIGEIFWGDLSPWSDAKLEDKHEAVKATQRLAKNVGKKLRENTAFYALRGECISDAERGDVERLVGLIKQANLNDRALEALTARIAA
jgi:hypothetical protein